MNMNFPGIPVQRISEEKSKAQNMMYLGICVLLLQDQELLGCWEMSN